MTLWTARDTVIRDHGRGLLLVLVALAFLMPERLGAEALTECPALDIPPAPSFCAGAPSSSVNATHPLGTTPSPAGSFPGGSCSGLELRTLACSQSPLSSGPLTTALRCLLSRVPNDTLDPQALRLLFRRAGANVLRVALDQAVLEVDSDQVPDAAKRLVLRAAWAVASAESQAGSPGFLGTWFQGPLQPLLPAVDLGVLECLSQLHLSCDGLATVVQALDSVAGRMEASSQRVVASWIGRFLTLTPCPKASSAAWLLTNWRGFRGQVSFAELTAAWPSFDAATALHLLSAPQLAAFTEAQGALDSPNLAHHLSELLTSADLRFAEVFLSALPGPSKGQHGSRILLETLLRKLVRDLPDLCSPTLRLWFQELLTGLLPALDPSLVPLLPSRLSCQDFQAVYKGLDAVHAKLTPPTQQALFQARRAYLRQQVAREGSACSFLAASSRLWLLSNLGSSSQFANYNDFLQLNPSFKGLEVTDLLTATQLGELLVSEGLLGALVGSRAEADVITVLAALQPRGILALRDFLQTVASLTTQHGTHSVDNPGVRTAILEAAFQQLGPELPTMAFADLEGWFQGALMLFLPSVTPAQLATLPLLTRCSQLETIIQDLDSAFDQMSVDTRGHVAQWAVTLLPQLGCNVSAPGGLTHTFQRFKTYVNISTLLATNPGLQVGVGLLLELGTPQLGQLVAARPGILTSKAHVAQLLERVDAISGIQGLANFWEELSDPRPQPWATAPWLRQSLLLGTLQRLGPLLATLPVPEVQRWFESRLSCVLDTVDAQALSLLPISLPCGSYRVLVSELSRKFEGLTLAQRVDVTRFLTAFLSQKSDSTGPACHVPGDPRGWILGYLGKFTSEASYAQLTASRETLDVGAVLDLLTPGQLGDALARSDTLAAPELDVRVARFFLDSPLEAVHAALRAFTAAFRSASPPPPQMAPAGWVLLTSLQRTKGERAAFTPTNWATLLREELYFLLPTANQTVLALLQPRDHEALVAIVAGLDTVSDQMPAATRRTVALWVQHQVQALHVVPAEPLEAWVHSTWGSFFSEMTLAEMQALVPGFQPATVLSLLAPRQLAELALRVAVLGNASAVRPLLRGLTPDGGPIPLHVLDRFLEMVKLELSQSPDPGLLDLGSRRVLLKELLPSLGPHLPNLLAREVQHWFQDRLQPLLPALDSESLALLPRGLGFPVYHALLQALGSALPQCPPQTAQAMFGFLRDVMLLQLQSRGSVFPGTYNDSQTFLQQLLGPFLPWASYSELRTFYPAFDGFKVLDRLSARHLGALLVASPALDGERLATRLLVKLDGQPPRAVVDFLSAFHEEVQQQGLSELPNAQVRALTLETVLRGLGLATAPTRDMLMSVGPALQLLLPGLSARLLPLLPRALDCEAQHSLVEVLDSAFGAFSEEQKQLVHGWLRGTLEARLQTHGATCSAGTTSSLWLSLNYGRFRSLASLVELSALKEDFDGVSARALLTPGQLAELTMLTGALAEEEPGPAQEVLEGLNTTDELASFLDTLTPAQLPSATPARLLLDLACRLLGPKLREFRSLDLALWFQTRLQPFLPAVDAEVLAHIPLDISCDAFRQIVKGFSDVFHALPPAAARDFFGFCRDFLSAKTSARAACGSYTTSSRLWLDAHLGNFSIFANYSDLLRWSLKFSGAQVLDRLSPAQLATFTVASGSLSRERDLNQVLAVLTARSSEFVTRFLGQFSGQLLQAPPGVLTSAVQEKILSQLLPRLEASLSGLDLSGWTQLLASQLRPLLAGARPKHVRLLLAHVSGCDNLQALVAALGLAHPSLQAGARRGIAVALVDFLDAQVASTGSACNEGTTATTPAWLHANFGPFSADVDFEVFLRLKPNFHAFEALENLTRTQMAHVGLSPSVLDNLALMTRLLGALRVRPDAEVAAFVSEFYLLASQRGLWTLSSAPIRKAVLDTVLRPVMEHLTSGPSAPDLEDWFGQKLQPWLPGVDAQALALLPRDLSCVAFQAVMAGLGHSWALMSEDSRRDVFIFAQGFLATRATPRGVPCSEPSASSLAWLHANLGPFSSLASYVELQSLHPTFQAMEVLGELSAPQLAEFLVVGGGLQDRSQATKVLEALRPEDTGPFLDALNAATHRLSRLPSPEVRRAALGLLSCHLSPAFQGLSAPALAAWFGDRLALFLPSLDAKTLSSLPEGLPCDVLEGLVHVLDAHQANGSFERPEDLAAFLLSSLQKQLQSTGSACAPPGTPDRTWLRLYWAFLSPLVSYKDLTALKHDFRGLDSLDLLSERALAQLTVQSGVIFSPSGVASVFQALRTRSTPLRALAAYLDELGPSLLKSPRLLVNPRVRDTMMTEAAALVFPTLPTLSLDDTTLWLERLEPLLPGMNATSLAQLPLSTPCQHYQAFVKALGNAFPRLPASRRPSVYARLKEYLAAQLADTGSACMGDMPDTGDWLRTNLGPFCREAMLGDLQAFLPVLDGVVATIAGPSGPLTEETLQALGPLATMLTPTELLSRVDGGTLHRALPVLAALEGWSPTQAALMVKKMLRAGLQVSQAKDVWALGTLVTGLPVAQVIQLDIQDVLQLAADRDFTKRLEQAPEVLQQALVLRALQGSQDLSRVPAPLAIHIPPTRLLSSQMGTKELREMRWSPDQARLLFSEALRVVPQFSKLPASVLQGFTCGAARALNLSRLAELSRAMAEQEVPLDRRQAGCLARRLADTITPSNLELYPPRVLLDLGPSGFLNPGTCETYFRLVGKTQISASDLQPLQVQSLLDGADHCLGLSGGTLSEEKLQVLGNVSCVLCETQIAQASTYILKALRTCPTFTAPQAAAIEQSLVAALGPPTTWTAASLQDMGILASLLSEAKLKLIPEGAKTQFFPDFLGGLKTHDPATFAQTLQHLRGSRRTRKGAVTAQRDLLVASYGAHISLDACLASEVLQRHLALLGGLAFEETQLRTLKERLDQVFGAPSEDLLPLLGNIARAYSLAEMAEWNITTVDTLAALLHGASWQQHPDKVRVLVGRFLETLDGPLGGPVLTLLAPHICGLDSAQLQRLDPSGIREASVLLDSTQCPQTTKDLLFRHVQAAFRGLPGAPQTHYQLLRSVLGGAPSEELVLLAESQPEMDIDTLVTLNPSEVQKLGPKDLAGLLGGNLPEMQSVQHHEVVRTWVRAHSPVEVAAVGLRTLAGTPDPPRETSDLPVGTPDPPRETSDLPERTPDPPSQTSDLPVETPNPPRGTSDLPEGTSDSPSQTSDLPEGTPDPPRGTLDLPEGTPDPPKGTLDLPEGTPDPPRETSDLPKGTPDPPRGTSDLPEGTPDPPSQTSDLPEGTPDPPSQTSDLPVETPNPPRGTLDLPVGTSDPPSGTSDLPERTPDPPRGTSDLPEGTSDSPSQTSDLPEGTSDLPERTPDPPSQTSDLPEGTSDSPGNPTTRPPAPPSSGAERGPQDSCPPLMASLLLLPPLLLLP